MSQPATDLLQRAFLSVCSTVVLLSACPFAHAAYREEWLTGNQLKQAQTAAHRTPSPTPARRAASQPRLRSTAAVAHLPPRRQPSPPSPDPIAAFSDKNRSGIKPGRSQD
ncbi:MULTISPECIES: hypothetical protein [Paraburkholderia]|uniref:hypothetical protein n=1 Tax=Paraburkholderia TaxID=1822464 RepID=UPI00115FBFC9|nr:MULTISPECIES: hypothetical protein [Paraburkholderia]